MNTHYILTKHSNIFFKRLLLALAMVLGGISVQAQNANNAYIFYNANYGYLINNGGNPGVSTTFTKSAIWVANNTLGNTSRNVRSYTDDTKYFTGTAGSYSIFGGGTNGTFSLGASNNNWRINNNYLRHTNSTYGYVRYDGSGFFTYQSDASQNFTALAITINSSGTPSNPAISITAAAGVSGGGIQLTGNVTGSYIPTYYYASVRNYNNNTNRTYYWTEDTEATTTQPTGITDWSDATKTWAVTTGGTYASVSSDGLVTFTGNPTGSVVVTLTVSKGGYTGTQTFTLTREAINQNVSSATVITGPTISPGSAALYYNESGQTFTAEASANNTTTTIPAHIRLTGGGNTYYYYDGTLYNSTEGFATTTSTPTAVTLTWSLSGAAATYLSHTPATGTSTTVTHTTQSPSDLTATLTVTASATGASDKTATATITAYGPMVEPTITRTGNTISITAANAGATIYYTTDGTTPSASNGIEYTTPFDLTTSPTTVKAIAIRDGHSSTVASETYQIQLPTPVITVSNTGLATITLGEGTPSGATIHYTIDGSTPTANSSTYTTPVQLTNPQTIMAIAVLANYANSEVVMDDYITGGIVSNKVILDDREDHSWSYYSDGSTPAHLHSLNPADVKITYFGNGNNVSTSDVAAPALNTFTAATTSVKVGIDADADTFIYLKTLERENANGTGNCPYTTIPNPFSVRPTYGTGDTRWRGFYAWRIKNVSGGSISGKNVGDTINAESRVMFVPSSEYSMQVELEALWARMYVGSGYQASVGYERNFVVGGAAINYPATYSALYPNGSTDGGTTLATSVPGTYDPNGDRLLSYDTKFEYINLTGNHTYTANNHYLCFGRGISTDNNAGTVQGINGNVAAMSYTLRVESGQFSAFAFVRSSSATVSGRYLVKAIMGCDYDRATNTNDKLSVSAESTLFFSTSVTFSGSGNLDQKTFDCVFKSGSYQENYWTASAQNQNVQQAYRRLAYLGQNSSGNTYPGHRYVTVEGGGFSGMCGGRGVGGESTTYMTPDSITFDLRIKGGLFHGCVYGGAADNPSIGSRRIIMTGGEVRSWIAGGCNGTGSVTTGTGVTNGNSYIYVGGHALVGGDDAMYINTTNGGQVFGAGRGLEGRTSSIKYSHVAIADEAVVSNNNNTANTPVGGNVYGGSYNGTIANESNVYILGGIVEGKVFGGSYGNGNTGAIPAANITMTGGLVTDGVYGGSNNTGTVNNVTMHIDGGQVGTTSVSANVHGGGYGQNTVVSGDVAVTLGTGCDATSGVTVYGDVYGGSAMGVVNTNSSNTTTVSLYKGTIYGGLYGGGYGPGGENADVNGKVYVKVYGGSVLCSASDPDGEAGTGSVFGCNNISGTPKSTVNVDIYGTDAPLSGYALHAVYGGGNKSAYTGIPVVTIHGCDNSIEYVYGGGNATDVNGTDVTIYGGTIGNAFGGGNGFSETGNHTSASEPHYNPGANILTSGTKLKIYGGSILKAFGGSNQYGTITGAISVIAESQTESGSDPCTGVAYTGCTVDVDELYGGGNFANITTDVATTVSCSDNLHIHNLYGGCNQANITGNVVLNVEGGIYQYVFGGSKGIAGTAADISGNVTLNLYGGTIENVFGGSNINGNIGGVITVNVLDVEGGCPLNITNIYGGSNLTSYTPSTSGITSPVVNVAHIKNGVRGNVYGGSRGEAGVTTLVNSNPLVNIGYDAASMDGYIPSTYLGTYSSLLSAPRAIVSGSVFGGGDAAKVEGNTAIFLRNKAKVFGNVYGGGNLGEVTGDTKVIVNGANE